MRIAYISHFYDGTGYSHAAVETVLAMDKVGIDVVPINVKLAAQVVQPPKRLVELLAKKSEGITTVVHHTLPHHLNNLGGVKNIGFFHCETSHFKPSAWQHYLNLMDECWTSCNQNIEAAKESGVNRPIRLVPIAYNPDKYKISYPNIGIDKGNRFVFYCVSDYSIRKNIRAIIKSYLEEFTHLDDVLLVLKTYLDGKSFQESFDIIQNDIQSIKNDLRKNSFDLYPKIALITDYLSEEQIMGLHQIGDAYITMERGAGFGLGAFDALAFGHYVIYSQGPGHCDFLTPQMNAYGVDSHEESVWGMGSCPFKNLYTSHERWYNPDTEMLKETMRRIYATRPHKSGPSLEDYTYESIGNRIKGYLNAE